MRDTLRQKKLQCLLEAKKNALLTELRKSMSEQRSENVCLSFELEQDDGDKSVGEHGRHVQSSVQSLVSDQLDDIERALKKLSEGTYGVCEDCGCDIPLQRLAIQPAASYCVACQEEIEKSTRRDTLWNKQVTPSADEEYDFLPDE